MPCHRSRLIGSSHLPPAVTGDRHIGQSFECTDRIVKYMANRPAKNMSSLDSQTIVPTLTRFGRVRECTRLDSKLGALAVEVTDALCLGPWSLVRRGGAGQDRVAIWPD